MARSYHCLFYHPHLQRQHTPHTIPTCCQQQLISLAWLSCAPNDATLVGRWYDFAQMSEKAPEVSKKERPSDTFSLPPFVSAKWQPKLSMDQRLFQSKLKAEEGKSLKNIRNWRITASHLTKRNPCTYKLSQSWLLKQIQLGSITRNVTRAQETIIR